MKETCVSQGCAAVAWADGYCIGHLPARQFADALQRLRGSGRIDGRGSTIEAGRVVAVLRASESPTTNKTRREIDLSEATISGELVLQGLALGEDLTLSGARMEQFAIRSVSGLNRLRLGTRGLRASAESLHIVTTGNDEELTLRNLDVRGPADIVASSFHRLQIQGCSFGKLKVVDTNVGALDVRESSWSEWSAYELTVQRGAKVEKCLCTRTSLEICRFESWLEISTTGSLDLLLCDLEGPATLRWLPADLLARHVPNDAGVDPPMEDAARLHCRSTRLSSAATIRWCGSSVSLISCVFSQTSTLDRALHATGRPQLRGVAGLDGEKLRMREVDLTESTLADAATLGAIEAARLRSGFGAIGWTLRRHLADEGRRKRYGELREDEKKAKAMKLAAAYRELRVGSEAVGNHAAANDLHYGERLWQRRAARPLGVTWIWLWLYGLFGYGVRPWRPFVWLVALVLVAGLLLDAEGLERHKVLGGGSNEGIATICDRASEPKTPEERQGVVCDVGTAGAIEFAGRSTTGILRPPLGYETSGLGSAVEISMRLLAALFLALFVLGVRNRVRR